MIISMKHAIGSVSQILTRHLFFFINEKPTWDRQHDLNNEVCEELLFWFNNLDLYNGHKIRTNNSITKVVFSDASEKGYGSFIIEKLGNIVARDNFNYSEKGTSSTYRELLAVKYSLESFYSLLTNQKILWHSDNTNVARIIQIGSRKPHLQKIALEIFKICLRFDIEITTQWIPREYNQIADQISKYIDYDDWSIDYESFSYIQEKFGKFTFDRFASYTNRKVNSFNSKFYCPGTLGVDSFTCDWSNHFNWLCPPISLIGDTLRHLKRCKGKGVLFVPLWRSAYYWPLITKKEGTFESFVSGYLILQPYFLSNCSSLFKGFANFNSIALYLDFSSIEKTSK